MPEAKPEKPGLIHDAILAVMADIAPLAKDRKNDSQHYSFRGIDDVYNVVQPILVKHGVYLRSEIQSVERSERLSKSGGLMAFSVVRARYFFVAKDGSCVSTDAVGEGMDSGDKSTPKALSIAQKYAILQMFCWPTADPKDPEVDSPEAAANGNGKPKAQPTAAPAAVPKPQPQASKPEPKPSAPITPEQTKRISGGAAAMTKLGFTPEQVWAGIYGEVKTKCGQTFAEPSEIDSATADIVLDYIGRWYKHVKAGKAKAAARHANEDADAGAGA
jgi:hypothetical protein